MEAKKKKEVCYVLRGGFCAMTAYGCSTLTEDMKKFNLKRIDIREWWKEDEAPFYL